MFTLKIQKVGHKFEVTLDGEPVTTTEPSLKAARRAAKVIRQTIAILGHNNRSAAMKARLSYGVSSETRGEKMHVWLTAGGKAIELGVFKTEQEAHEFCKSLKLERAYPRSPDLRPLKA